MDLWKRIKSELAQSPFTADQVDKWTGWLFLPITGLVGLAVGFLTHNAYIGLFCGLAALAAVVFGGSWYAKIIREKPSRKEAQIKGERLEQQANLRADASKSASEASEGNSPLRSRGKPEEALHEYEKITALQPHNARAWYGKGIALVELRRHEEALRSFEEAISLETDHTDSWRFKGLCLEKLDRNQEALSAYEKAIRLEPNDLTTRMSKADLQTSLGRHEEALRSYDEAISVKPDDPTAWYCKACSMGRLGRWEEALLTFGASIKIKPDYEAWFMKGIVLDIIGRHDEALRAFEELMRLQSMQHEGSHSRGSGPKRLVRDKNASRRFDEAISLNPNLSKAWFEKGEVVTRKYAQEELLARLLESCPRPPPRRKPGFDDGLAMIRLDESLLCVDSPLQRSTR